MVEENKDQTAEAGTGEAGKEELTLDSLNKTLQEIKLENERIRKQNADKDHFNDVLKAENKDLRENIQKISSAVEGKTEKQKDAFLDAQRKKFLDKGYDEDSVDLILETASLIAKKETKDNLIPIVMDTVDDLIDSDPELDRKFLEEHQQEIMEEYNGFKPENTPKKIKTNVKKAYKAVQERLAQEAKGKEGEKGKAQREEMVAGAGQPGSAKQPASADEEKKAIDAIEKAGISNSRFI